MGNAKSGNSKALLLQCRILPFERRLHFCAKI